MNSVELDTHRTTHAEREGRGDGIEELRRSRQYLAEAQKLTHTGSWAWSPLSGALLYWSEECYRILGFDPARGLPSFDATAERIHPEDRPETLAKIEQYAQAGKDFELEYRLLLPDGLVRNVRIFAHPVRNASGVVVEFIGTVVDVTEQKRAEEERLEYRLEARLQATLNMIPAYTYYAAPGGALTFVNERCADYLGLAKDHPLRFGVETGAPWDAHIPLLHPDDQDESRRIWSTMLATGSPGEKSFRVRNAEGTYRWFLSRAEPLRAKDGTLLYWVGINLDIEELKRAEEERREHLWFLESLDRINRAMQRTNDVEAMMRGVLEETLAIFGSDRARLVYPCDPDVAATRVVMEHSRPEYPGAFAIGEDVPMDRHAAEFVRRVLDSPGAATDLIIPPEMRARFRIQTAIAIAVRPKGDRPYLFGLHQCSHARTWTAAERRLLEEIARRLEDALTSVLAHRNLLASEEELRRSRAYLAEAQGVSHTGSWAWSPDSNAIVYWSQECYRILGHDPAEGLPSFPQLMEDVHPEDRPGLAEGLDKAVRTRGDWQAEYRLVNFADGPRTVHCMAHPILDGAGQVLEYVGTVMDVTEQKRAEEERREHLWFLESMDRINRAMQRTNDVEAMMSGVLEEAVAIFGCDRAWLIYPCDPDAPSVRAVMEHTSPGYPGAFALGEEFPVDAASSQLLRHVLHAPGAVENPAIPAEIHERFSIESMIAIAVRPKRDTPYLFGLHQCSRPRTWTAVERRLFEETARRLEDALTGVLAHRNLIASQEELRTSEQRFRTFVDHATDAFFLYDDHDIVRDVNRQACETTGYAREELIGMHPREFNAGLTPEKVEWIRGQLHEHGYVTFNNLRQRKDGTHFPVEIRARAFERGGRAFTIALATDITERRRREQCLLAQHGVTKALSEAASVEDARPRILRAIGEALGCDFGVLWHLDLQAGLLRCAEAWSPDSAARPAFEAAMKAATFEPGMDLPGRVWSTGTAECISDLAADPSSARAGLVANDGLHAAFAFPIAPRTGHAGVIEFFSRKRRDPDPEILQMGMTVGSQVGQFIERSRAEDALRATRSELAHVTRVMSMGELTASIAHEVNQPLGAMVTSAASASRWLAAIPPNIEKASMALARIGADGERASAVIDRMRMLIKRQEPGREPVDVNETILSVVALMRDELERTGIAYSARLADDVPPVLSDRVLLQQVILNLILNAIDAMRGIGDRARALSIESRLDDDGEVRIQVRDTGSGLPPDARLFEAFYTTKERGLGMGLSISRSIVESHGGRMDARPNEPHGAIFEFSLPVTRP